jgi:hypothetical protein
MGRIPHPSKVLAASGAISLECSFGRKSQSSKPAVHQLTSWVISPLAVGLVIRLSATVGVTDAFDMVGDTHVAATVAFEYCFPCFLGGSHDFPNSLAGGSIGGKEFDVRDTLFGDINDLLRRLLLGAGRRTSLLGIHS